MCWAGKQRRRYLDDRNETAASLPPTTNSKVGDVATQTKVSPILTTADIEAMPITDRQLQFHLDEFDALRREIELNLNDEQRREQHSVIAIAAVYAWLSTSDTGGLDK